MRFDFKSWFWMLMLSLLAGLVAAPALAAGPQKSEPVGHSADKRFADLGDGTIHDQKTGLVWMTRDYWQTEKKWINWYTASEYVQRMNNKKFAGHEDWRLPTPEEARTLYDHRKRNVDKDGDKMHIDPVFPPGAGWSTWTNEDKESKAIVVSFKGEGGQEYQDKITGVDAFLRLVRGPVS